MVFTKDRALPGHSLTRTPYTNTTSEHQPQLLILRSPPSHRLLMSEPSPPSFMFPRVSPLSHHPSTTQSPGSHCGILTRSWSRRSLCLALSEVRVPRVYCSGVADPSEAVAAGSQSPWLSLYLGHSSPAVTAPHFPGCHNPLTGPAGACPRKQTLPRGSLPQLSRDRVRSDSFLAPRHRLSKSNRLRGDARETSDRTAGRKSRLPPALLSIPPPPRL